MILNRLGNKKGIAKEVYKYFPPHRMRITLFFGAGGMFFSTPRAKYNIINDLDDDVCNLFTVISDRSEDLIDAVEYMPISESLLKNWRKTIPQDPVQKAARFLLISNFTYLGRGDSIRFGVGREKEKLIGRIKKTYLSLGDTRIMSRDFRDVLHRIAFHPNVLKKEDSFIYMDPVYLDTDHFYRVPTWTRDDTVDCLDIMANEGIPAAMSEFNHPFVIEQAEKRGLNIFTVKERRNINNRRVEILVTNYDLKLTLFEL